VRLRDCFFLFIVWLVSGVAVAAQSPNGTINGLVLDPSGRAMADAEITIVNDSTRVQYTSKTNGEGIYVVNDLPPGPYRLQVSKVGFKTLIKPDIVLNVQDALDINFTLPIGAISETVTVQGGAAMIDTQDATVSTVVDRQFAENLPMNGRSFQTLIYLTPGVVATPTTATEGGQFSVNGQRTSSNYWMVDGVSANIGVGSGVSPGNGLGGTLGSFSALGGTNSLVSVDAMQEFRIQTSTFAPEFGRTPGAQISILTRSGTNQFHGTAFDYLRNSALDANNWFADSEGLAKPAERQNDFGGTFSGPVYKDKTFFFFSYEGLRLELPETTLSNVPDIAARQNAVAAMQSYLNAYPQPNGLDNPGTGVAQFNASYSNPASLDAYSLRIDQQISSRWSVFGRYNYSPSEFTDRGLIGGSGALSDLEPSQITTQTLTIGATGVLSSALTNDLRFNYSRTNAKSYSYLDGFGGAAPLAALPFPAGFTEQNGLFDFVVIGLGMGGQLAVGKSAQSIQRQVNVVDGLSWQRGTHSFKFGVDVRRLAPSFDPFEYEQAAPFLSVSAAQTGDALVGEIVSRRNAKLLFYNLGAYAQDTWRVTPRLTLTYGLRWDVDFAPSSGGGLSIPAVVNYNLANLSQLAIAPLGTPPFKTTYGNFAPRLGVAYQISQNHEWQSVLRGGFGTFYDLASAETGNAFLSLFPPFASLKEFGSATFPFTSAQIAPPPIPAAASLSEFEAFNPNLKLPYTLEWNVAVEQSLGQNQTLSATYLGSVGRRLLQTNEVSSPPTNPDIGLGEFIDNTSQSNYNALQIQFQRRLSDGFQALASYTWAHSIDDASSSYTGSSYAITNSENRGNSDFDIRNSLSAGLTYDIPGKGKSALVNAVLRGWSADSFVLIRSAPPVDVTDANFSELDGGILGNVRPDVVAGQPFYFYGSQCASVFQEMGELAPGGTCPGGKALNPSAFTDPPVDPITGNPTRQGTLGRNVLRGFGATQWDFAVHRNFTIREPLTLQFRAEMFNLLNHPNFGPPYSQFGSAGFGLSTETLAQSLSGPGSAGNGGFNPLYQIGGPRSIQLALKLLF
jgi:Carboxypeptidase regulatory-like domain/TonB dependent receptor